MSRDVKYSKYPEDDSVMKDDEVEDDSWSSRRGLKSLLGMREEPEEKSGRMQAQASSRKGYVVQ